MFPVSVSIQTKIRSKHVKKGCPTNDSEFRMVTLRLTNIAIETGPLEDVFPMGIFQPAMLVYQRVHIPKSYHFFPDPDPAQLALQQDVSGSRAAHCGDFEK